MTLNIVGMQPKQWVVANWKMNPYFEQAESLFSAVLDDVDDDISRCCVAIAPPMPYLSLFVSRQQKIPMVSQDLSVISGTGAYTGEVSAELLISSKIQMVLIGHSERRKLFVEDSQILQQKVRNALQAGLSIIFCVGETLEQRNEGRAVDVVIEQLKDLVEIVEIEQWQKVIIAYEPVWAIGTGKTALPIDAQSMHQSIRKYLQTVTEYASQLTLLYGGSVNAENAVELAKCPDVNGALVGGASLDVGSFKAIIKAFSSEFRE